jgi:aminomethyltransferase
MYLSHEDAKVCFQKLTHQNHAKAIGLGARDTLRLESCYLLYGQDMNDQVSPIEAGIGWATKTDKGDFIGRTLAVKHKAKGAERRQMSAFLMEDKGVARSDMDIYWNGRLIGKVTSGSHLPSLNQAGGMALISKDTAKTGDTVEIDVRGKRKLAKLVARPLYSPKVK